ncbi:MAG: type IV pilus assembly protein PilM [Patescibacteria group bacterium]|jgi:type IV pilus assembly protein PilM
MLSSGNYLGIDIGTASLKLVELRSTGGVPELATYGIAELPLAPPTQARPSVEELGDTLADLVRQTKAVSRKCYSALPTDGVFTSIISLPQLKKKEFLSAVEEEAAKLLPRPVSEMVLDPQILGDTENGKTQRVLLVAAPKDLVSRYDAIFKRAKLELLGLETEGFALIRSLVGRDSAGVGVIDFGASTSDITIIADAIPYLNRSMAVGGRNITVALSQALGLSLIDAEQVKRDIGLVDENGNVPEVLEKLVRPLIEEVRYTIQQFQQRTGRSVEKLILSGGSAMLGGLSEYIEQSLHVRTYVGDPWSRVRYPVELGGLLQASASRYGIALGLALRPLKP